jgi:hypothetical protein
MCSFPRLLLTVLLTTPCAGCYSTWDIPIKEVNRLDGYRAPLERRITDNYGNEVPVDGDTELRFHAKANVEVPEVPDLQGHFTAIDVHKGPEAWLLDGVLRGGGQPVRVDLREVVSVQAKRYSPGTTAAVILVPTLTVALAMGITMGLVVNFAAHVD